MAPFSKALAGLVKYYGSCGSHLKPSEETIDSELEKNNFKVAGYCLRYGENCYWMGSREQRDMLKMN